LAFLSYPFMCLVGTFDPILEVAAVGREQLYYLVGTLRGTSTMSNLPSSADLLGQCGLSQCRRVSALALCKPCRPAAARARLTAATSECPPVARNHGQLPLVRSERGTKRRLLVAEL
jgi:hypothetical protein